MTADADRGGVAGLVDHLFRQQAGRLVALVAAALGPRHLDLAEEVVQDALVSALHTWPHRGIPDNPPAWLLQVARNRALDAIRRRRFLDEDETALEAAVTSSLAPSRASGDMDAELALVFTTCHPALPAASRIALTLKVACGLSVAEIARALLADESAIAQRIVRAKRQIRDQLLPLALPEAGELGERLPSVLDALYLLFNEGYAATDGDALVRDELCFEALRLARLVAAHRHVGRPEAHALAALMLFQAARLPARVGHAGDLHVLEQQDRRLWEWPLVDEAFRELDAATTGPRLTSYHVQAAIAAVHASASRFADTDWPRIVELYDELMTIAPTPIVALNRAVAIGLCHGPVAGLAALAPLGLEPALSRYHLFFSSRARFLGETGDVGGAADNYRRALACQLSEPERRFLESQRARLALLDRTSP
ncbi:MAG TPA: sigma-70 family RNA polymerase sigma factor [Vicinamibacterales bacterium]|nr:sigma-70 family RNA polymerase sigma factor [Vicinamibacterales bacterium]